MLEVRGEHNSGEDNLVATAFAGPNSGELGLLEDRSGPRNNPRWTCVGVDAPEKLPCWRERVGVGVPGDLKGVPGDPCLVGVAFLLQLSSWRVFSRTCCLLCSICLATRCCVAAYCRERFWEDSSSSKMFTETIAPPLRFGVFVCLSKREAIEDSRVDRKRPGWERALAERGNAGGLVGVEQEEISCHLVSEGVLFASGPLAGSASIANAAPTSLVEAPKTRSSSIHRDNSLVILLC